MDFHTTNQSCAWSKNRKPSYRKDKDVIVIGGDTGSDCVGTSNRQGAKSVTILKLCPNHQVISPTTPWPYWPLQLKTSSSRRRRNRDWLVNTKEFVTDNGKLIALKTVKVEVK